MSCFPWHGHSSILCRDGGPRGTPACSLGAQQCCPGSPRSSFPPHWPLAPAQAMLLSQPKPQPQPSPRILALVGAAHVAAALLRPPQTTSQGCEHLQSLLEIQVMVGGSTPASRCFTKGSHKKAGKS